MLKDESLDKANTKIGLGVAGGAAVSRPPKPKPKPPEQERPRMTDEQILQLMKSIIGTRFSAAVKVNIEDLTQRPVIGPGDLSTRELNPNRITLRTNAQGVIEGCSFG
ncbi:hypothetical protein ABI582_04615 [Pseudomonas sp. SAS7]|uniref:hypothetical protein n=1 Tax=Pseudomonas sp. SAS7 TaxID=3156487 RepID=UPI003F968A4E